MKAQLLWTVVAAALLCPASAFAQRVPHEGGNAAGVDLGVFLPQDSGLDNSVALDGFFEHYLSARDSVRAVVGWTDPGVTNDSTRSIKETRIGGDLLHNWEYGDVHPYLGAGLGAYFLRNRLNGNTVPDGRTQFGGNVFGGVEFFTSNSFAVKGEAAYHVVSKADNFNPSGLLLTIGGKVYF